MKIGSVRVDDLSAWYVQRFVDTLAHQHPEGTLHVIVQYPDVRVQYPYGRTKQWRLDTSGTFDACTEFVRHVQTHIDPCIRVHVTQQKRATHS